MTCPSTQLRLAPITTGLVRRNPRILLSGPHQPTLVRYLEGWPKRWNGSRTFLIQFAQDGRTWRASPATRSTSPWSGPGAEDLDLVVRQLIRVARRADHPPYPALSAWPQGAGGYSISTTNQSFSPAGVHQHLGVQLLPTSARASGESMLIWLLRRSSSSGPTMR